MNVTGVVTAVIRYGHGHGFYMQNGRGEWSGIQVDTGSCEFDFDCDGANDIQEPYWNLALNRAAFVEVLGTVVEINGTTRIGSVSQVRHVQNTSIPEPVEIRTGSIGNNCSIASEQYEGMLVRVLNATVVSNVDEYNQIAINDGSGTSEMEDGVYDAAVHLTHVYGSNMVGSRLVYLQGVVEWRGTVSGGNWEIHPRTETDVVGFTFEPSPLPTLMPTLAPSISLLPTRMPSALPSFYPSSFPSIQPTLMPSALPSFYPSSFPSIQPTSMPTAPPSLAPTLEPSSLPSLAPTLEPTTPPSPAPTKAPTLQPTTAPTLRPTTFPTPSPTASPTLLPTPQPSPVPYSQPTFRPSSSPQPTVGDSVRLSVSLDFTATAAPTDADSATLQQTVATQLSLSLTNIHGWALTYHFSGRKRHRRIILADVVWAASFAVVTEDDDVDTLSTSTSVLLSDASFQTAVTDNLGSTVAVDTSTIDIITTTRPPTVMPTSLPSHTPTLDPTSLPSLAPSLSPTTNPTSLPTPRPTALPTSRPTPSLCPAGTYAKVDVRYNCTSCPNGKYTEASGSTECASCAAGSIMNADTGATSCTACDGTAGQYIGEVGQTACFTCPAGFVVDAASAATSCIACDGTIGEYIGTVGRTVCDACPAGSIVNLALAATTCTPCGAGTIAAAAGATICDACAAGTIAEIEGLDACTSCAAGKESASTSECAGCVAGKYSATPGSSACTSAELGKYVDVAEATEATDCIVGYYSDETGSTACKSCEDLGLYYQKTPGSSDCIPCPCFDKKDAEAECTAATGDCTCSPGYVGTGNGRTSGNTDCDDAQSVGLAIKMSYSFFGFLLFFCLPFMFCTGGLAALAGVWRKTLGIGVCALRGTTHKAVQMNLRKLHSDARRDVEMQLKSAFLSLDEDASGLIDEDELREILWRVDLPEEHATAAIAAVDKDSNGMIDYEEFYFLISFVAPFVKERRTRARYQAIFDILDEDQSDTIDANELRESSEVLGVSLDHIADGMSASDSLSFRQFGHIIDEAFTVELHESAAKMRAVKEVHYLRIYERLRRSKDGAFTLGSFRKSLAAIGLPLSRKERLALLSRHLLQRDIGREIILDRVDIESGSTDGQGGAQAPMTDKTDLVDVMNEQTRVISYRDYRLMLSAAVLLFDCDYLPMSLYKEAFLHIPGDAAKTAPLGFIPMQHLHDLFIAVGHEMSADEVAKIASDLDRGDGLLLFDNFADVMMRFTDTELEEEILEGLNDKAYFLRIELTNFLWRLVKFVVVVIGLLLFSLFTCLVDIYLMAKSFYAYDPKLLKKSLASYAHAILEVTRSLRPLPIHYFPVKWFFHFLPEFQVRAP